MTWYHRFYLLRHIRNYREDLKSWFCCFSLAWMKSPFFYNCAFIESWVLIFWHCRAKTAWICLWMSGNPTFLTSGLYSRSLCRTKFLQQRLWVASFFIPLPFFSKWMETLGKFWSGKRCLLSFDLKLYLVLIGRVALCFLYYGALSSPCLFSHFSLVCDYRMCRDD